MGPRAVLCSGAAGEGAIELCAEGSRYLKAVQAGFPAGSACCSSHLLHREGDVPEDDNSLFAYPQRVACIE